MISLLSSCYLVGLEGVCGSCLVSDFYTCYRDLSLHYGSLQDPIFQIIEFNYPKIFNVLGGGGVGMNKNDKSFLLNPNYDKGKDYFANKELKDFKLEGVKSGSLKKGDCFDLRKK